MKHITHLLCIICWIMLSELNAQPALQWTRSFNSPGNSSDIGKFITTGPGGTTFVTGTSNLNIMTIAYSSSGQKLWTQIFNGTGNANDVPTGITADAAGNLFVTGYTQNISGNYDWVLIKYNISGNQLWKKTYNLFGSEDERAYAMALDGAGNIYVAGTGILVDTGIVTIKYNSSGNEIWQKVFSGPDPGSIEIPTSVKVDASGNLYILGSCTRNVTGQDYVVVKYSSGGTKLWASFYGSGNSTEVPVKLGLDAAKNAIITGYQYSGSLSNANFLTVSFDSTGNQKWAHTYNGPNSGNDQATDLAIDNLGNILITGFSEKSSTENYLTTLKYNTAGVQQWVDNWWVPGGAGNNRGNSILVNSSGDVYVTGVLDSIPGEYAATVKYNSNGNRLWQNLYNPLTGIHMEGFQNSLDDSGNILCTGVYDYLGGALDFLTMKIDPSGILLWVNIEDGRTMDGMLTKKGMTTDASGNIYIAGTSTNTSGNDDILTLKYDKLGNLQWTKFFNGIANGDDHASSIGIDDLGNVYVSGSSSAANGMDDWVTIKYSGSGIIQWVTTYNGTANDQDWPTAMKVDAAGNVFVTGYSRAGAGPTLNGNIVTIKYTTNGTQQWVATYNNAFNEEDWPNDIELDGSGNVFIAGLTRNYLNHNPLALKYNSSGAQQWVWTLASNNNVNQLSSIKISNTGLVIAAGNFWNGTNQVVFVVKINNSTGSGNFSFSGLPYKEEFMDMLLDSQNNIYINKSFETNGAGSDKPYIEKWDSTFSTRNWSVEVSIPNIQLAPYLGCLNLSKLNYLYLTIPAITYHQYAALKYDTNGNLLWHAEHGDSPNTVTPYSSCIDDSGNLTISGISYLTNDNGLTHLTSSIFTISYEENVQTNTLSSNSYCQGAPVNIPFSVTGSLNVSNIFTAQLSNASGSFSSPVSLGSIAGTGAGTINATIPVSTPAGTGYRIRVISSNPALAPIDNGTNITINALPVPSISGITGICSGSPASITAQPAGTYLWNTTETTQTIHPTDPGTYTVTVTAATGCSNSISVAVVVSVNPSPVISYETPTTICPGQSVTLSSSQASSYLWNFGATSRYISVSTSGNYFVTVTNSYGCSGTSSPVTVTVPITPTISSISPASAIPGATVTINGVGFNTDASKNYVFFGACKGFVSSASTTQLQVIIPGGATHDRICMVVNPAECGYTAYSKEFFIPKFNCPNTALQFSASPAVPSGTGSPQTIKVTDLDGDRKPDLLVANNTSSSFSVFRNTSSPASVSFASRLDINVGGGQIEINCADMDGDGKLDVVLTRASSSFISIFRNTSSVGSVSFSSPVNLPLSSTPNGLALSDFNNDGNVDIAVSLPATFPNNQISIYKNTNPSGTIDPSLFIYVSNLTAGTTPNKIVTGDIDKDGKPDLLSVNASGNTLSLFQNLSSGGSIGFGSKIDFATGTSPTGGIGLADFDLDTKTDVIFTNAGSNTFSILRNLSSPGTLNASSFAARQDFSAGTAPSRLTVADFDGDGKPDPAILTGSSNVINIYRNTTAVPGTISFAAAVPYNHSITNPTNVASGDLDNDAHTDLIYCDGTLNNIYIRRSTVSFASVTATGPTTFCPGASVQLIANSGAGYLWSTGATTPSIIVSTAGSFNVTVNGCTSTPVITSLYTTPSVSISPGGPTDICPGATVTLTASAGFSTYHWNTGANGNTLTTGVTGAYTVTATDANSCTVTSSPQSVTVKEINNSIPGISLSKLFGGTLDDGTITSYGDRNLIVNPDGTYTIAGNSYSSDGDITGHHYDNDAWVVKTTHSGTISWQKSLGGLGYDALVSISPTSDNGYICAGYTFSFDADAIGNHGVCDAWVVKLDQNGQTQWSKCYGTISNDNFNSVIQTSDGGYLCAGKHAGFISGDVTAAYGNGDVWVVKLSSTGTIQWQKTFGGSQSDEGRSLIALADGNFLLAASSASTDFDVTGNHGNKDYWILKLNPTGTLLWSKCLGGSQAEEPVSVREAPDGSLVLNGYSYSNDGDVSGNHGNGDMWVVKLNANGILQWNHCFGGSAYDYGSGTQITFDGGIAITGSCNSTDGTISGNHGSTDGWIAKLNGSGTLLWNKCFGGSSTDYLGSLVQELDGSITIAGSSASSNGDLIGNHGSSDTWLLRLKNPVITATGPVTICSGNTVTLAVSGGLSYAWSNGSNAASISVTESGNYAVTADGCFTSDSVHVSVTQCNFSLIIRSFVEGFYQGSGTMLPVLDPVSQPLVCDTVRLQLYRAVFPYDLLYQDTALMDLQGYCTFSFYTAPGQDQYYLALRHRNSLETWSASPLLIDAGIKSYDFSTASSQAYGNNLKDLGDGRFALWSGDVNQDGSIGSSDFSSVENMSQQLLFGYVPEDLTGDNLVESADYSLIENNLQLLLIVARP